MPRRSNEFQRLILAAYRQVSGDARVVESLELPDRDGTLREIDVAIEVTQGIHTLRIAVECSDRSRPMTVQWIDQLYGKYENLDVQSVVAIARSFTASALTKAKELGIRALTFEELDRATWVADLTKPANFHVTKRWYRPKTATFHVTPPAPQSFWRSAMASRQLRRPSGELATVDEFIRENCKGDVFKALCEKVFEETPSSPLVVEFPADGWRVRANTEERDVSHVQVVVEREESEIVVPATPARFGDVELAYGSFTSYPYRYSVVTANPVAAVSSSVESASSARKK